MSIDAMKQALEVLEEINKLSVGENAICLPAEIDGAMDALRAAIEQAEKPWVKTYAGGKPNYTTPQWQDLTGEEIADLITAHAGFPLRLTEAVEAKLKEKNT